jgi:polyhydroxyalkanoate synthase subunit PhaC
MAKIDDHRSSSGRRADASSARTRSAKAVLADNGNGSRPRTRVGKVVGAPRAVAGKAAGAPRAVAGKVAGAPRAVVGKVAGAPRAVVGKAARAPRAVVGGIEGRLHIGSGQLEPDHFVEHAVDHAGGAGAPGPSPFVGFGVRDLLSGLRFVGAQVVRQPAPLVRSLPATTRELVRIVRGRSDLAPDRSDKRFRDPAWDNFLSRRVVQIYLELGSGVEGFVGHSKMEGVSAERGGFALGLVRDALSPANLLLLNPEALKRAVGTKGGSLGHGARNFGDDLVKRRGLPNQVDRTPFAVGKNLAVSPGAVVHRTPVYELIQYTPQTEQVYQRPMLIVPPQVNKYYAMDLRPGRSMYEYLLQQGIQLFGVSWFNPTPAERDWGFDTYIQELLEATDVVREISGSEDLNAMGGCAGGLMLTLLAASLEGRGDRRINAASTLVTLLDSAIHADVLLFATPKTIAAAKRVSARKGVLEGRQMAKVFAWLRPNDLVWNYWVNNYLLGKDPPSFDILAWNADTTRLPARFHHELLDFVSRNQLVNPGDLEILGMPVDASQISCDSYHVGGRTDHITPWEGCYRTTQMLGGESQFVLCSSGHIQTLIASLDNPKLAYYVNPKTPPDPDSWFDGATRHDGSWWPHWAGWLRERSGELRDAPSTLGSKEHPAADPAPGQYVMQ